MNLKFCGKEVFKRTEAPLVSANCLQSVGMAIRLQLAHAFTCYLYRPKIFSSAEDLRGTSTLFLLCKCVRRIGRGVKCEMKHRLSCCGEQKKKKNKSCFFYNKLYIVICLPGEKFLYKFSFFIRKFTIFHSSADTYCGISISMSSYKNF